MAEAAPESPPSAAEAPARARRGARRAFRDGAAISFSFMLVGAPFGLLFGAVATEAGLPIAETMALSVVVMAGAAQFALVELLADGAPALIALMAAFAVNLRMLMYSASIAPHLSEARLRTRLWMAYFLVDQVYAASIHRFTERPNLPLREKTAFWLGVGGPMFVVWYGATYAGAVVGARIPEGWSLDFAPAITSCLMSTSPVSTPTDLTTSATMRSARSWTVRSRSSRHLRSSSLIRSAVRMSGE